jgi:hypothetical protein
MKKNEFTKQYEHTFRLFERLVKDFDENTWLQAGRGVITPARLSLHILIGTKYYLEDPSEICFSSGKSFERNWNWQTVSVDKLPSQNDILVFIREMMEKTEKWLFDLDFGAENKSFPWAGETKLGVVIFLLRHSLFHIGELSSLLNESKDGIVEDHWVKAL